MHRVDLSGFEGGGFPFRLERLGVLGSIGASQFDLVCHSVFASDLVDAHIRAIDLGW